jgi:valyl-tRNA synthetase
MSTRTASAPVAEDGGNLRQLSHVERKQLQRAVQKAEKEVHRLEKLIEDIEGQMAAPDFFVNPTHQNTLKKHNQAQQDLERAMQEWLEAQEALEL